MGARVRVHAFLAKSFQGMATAATKEVITVLEHSRVSPSSYSAFSQKSFPLSYLDIPWLSTHPLHILLFHELSHPKSHSICNTIPNLKHSLAITLQHFLPLAGNLIIFPFTDSASIPRKPEIRYEEGDSVSFTVAEARTDFAYLTSNDARKANGLYPLVPKLGDLTRDSCDSTIHVPLLALQVTLFPNHGICIGITCHHVVVDASSILNFVRAWASVTKFGNDKPFVSSGSLPVFDKSDIKDPSGIGTMVWNHIAKTQFQDLESAPKLVSGNDDLVRASFIMTKDQINRVKKFILAHRPKIAQVSSFTIICAHVWTCIAKARNTEKGLDEPELAFGFLAECRARLDPPLPTTTFGNFLVSLSAKAKHDKLVGEEGLFNAVEVIGVAIRKGVKSKESMNAGWKNWMGQNTGKLFPTTVAGSPKYDFYDTDFGWGKPKKYQLVSIDYHMAISLNRSRESEQDIEITLSLPKIQMDVFQTIFKNQYPFLDLETD